jgi:hypothetical protein
MRGQIRLSSEETAAFNRIPPLQGEAWNFWKRVAVLRKLDADTLLWENGVVTALPLGHGKQWCYPLPLKCRKRAA